MRNPKPKIQNPKSFLITAGPTVEDIDPVRFISNRASGRLGVEIVRAALRRGHRVVFIHGPLSENVRRTIPSSRRLTEVPVRSAEDMHRAVMRHAPAAGVVIMNAAVADYTPVRTAPAKIKKSRRELTLRLRPTVDILKKLGESRTHRDDLLPPKTSMRLSWIRPRPWVPRRPRSRSFRAAAPQCASGRRRRPVSRASSWDCANGAAVVSPRVPAGAARVRRQASLGSRIALVASPDMRWG
ncbi:MAG: phosphopantothenoylcysteine decarboxylase [Planctomycetota bacterium]|nr:phosphopantothenoylcysteine decarboxylase [Planctomycetota bacterium]